MALSQISEFLTLILDRISILPSPWLEGIVPLLTWLTIHKGDQLLNAVFDLNKSLRKDFARVHKIIENFCNQEFKSKPGKL